MWGMPRDQFWRLTPTEFWWEAEARQPVKKHGDLAHNEIEELYQMLQEGLREEEELARYGG